ncbi:MAG: Signal peptidase-like protein [Bacteroidia bacterium]|nr:Signal peptidase-like protein [Bacteroidia bacterium]MDW8346508.1 regulatory iron-sulfur-containing complex subunit RicT [Bacteroidia bacterium]
MGCHSCNKSCGTAGCKSCALGGCSSCNKLNTYDWLAGLEDVKPFNIHEVRFKADRKDFFENVYNLDLVTGDWVAVEGENGGYDVGQISLSGELVRLQMLKKKVNPEQDKPRKIYRKANEQDLQRLQEARDKEMSILYRTREIIKELGLEMKLSEVEFQGDKSRIIFYYTAENRVDFRELIKILADEFKGRIEMRQIGLRQEAAKLGGIGSCGRELCCSTWLTDFKSVNVNAAKYQYISLNSTRLSGQCGRLKCCLNYELDLYLEALNFIPKVEKPILTLKGEAIYEKTDIFKKLMWFSIKSDNTWYAVPIDRVNQLLEMQANGIVIESLLETPITSNAEEKSTEFVDVVGQSELDNKKQDKPQKRKRKRSSKEGKERKLAAQQKKPNIEVKPKILSE